MRSAASQAGRGIREAIEALARVPSRAAAGIAKRIASLIKAQFAAGTDPYGTPWAKLSEYTIAKGRTEPPLYDTGKMYGSIEVKPLLSAGIAITLDAYPASFHQVGTVNMPARPILPKRGLPMSWQKVIREELGKAAR